MPEEDQRSMSQNWRIGLVVGVLVLGAVLLGTILLQAGVVLWQIVEFSNVASKLPDTLEQFVDQHIDAGYEDPVIHAGDALLNDRKVLLSQDVNARAAKQVAARLFYLNSVDNRKSIDLYISTQGGWADNAFTIIDAMRLIEAPVNTWAVGGCYSAGAMILSAGTGRRVATDNAIIMVHTNLEDSSGKYTFDRLALARYENLWRSTASLPDDWYPMTSDKRYYLTADEAQRFDIVDEVVHTWAVRRTPEAK